MKYASDAAIDSGARVEDAIVDLKQIVSAPQKQLAGACGRASPAQKMPEVVILVTTPA